MWSKRLAELSCNREEFAKTATPYNIAVKTSGYRGWLIYDHHATDTCERKKKSQAQYIMV